MYSEKATKFCEIFALLLTTIHTVKSKVKILQNFVAFSEYMNFKCIIINQFHCKNLISTTFKISEDKIDIQKILTWAKSSKKKKTATMVIREKKKLDMFKKAVDVDAIPIIIEDSFTNDIKNGL